MSDFQESQQDVKSKLKPVPSIETVKSLLDTHWNVTTTKIRQIDSYDDANFYCTTSSKASDGSLTEKCVLVKFYNAIDTQSPEILHGLAFMLSRINEQVKTSIQVPSVILPVQQNSAAQSDGANFIFVDNCEVTGAAKRLWRFAYSHGLRAPLSAGSHPRLT